MDHAQMDSETRTGSENLDSCGWPEKSKSLAENLMEMDHSIKRMLKLIEEKNVSSTVHHEDGKPGLIVGVKEFHSVYRSLAERYDQLMRDIVNSFPLDIQLSFSDQNASSPLTANGKFDSHKSGGVSVSSSSGSGSSDISPNAGSDSSSSESDSESESFYSSLNNHLVSPGTTDSQKEKLVGDESIVRIRKPKNYSELTKKIVNYEEELKITNLKLRVSEQEVEKLKDEIEKNRSEVVLAETLRVELETAQREIGTRDADVEAEKRQVLELQSQVHHLETNLSDSTSKIEILVSELEVTRECLGESEAEISKLREILSDCQQNFSAEKANMKTDMACLSEKQTSLETQLKDLESQCELLKDEIRSSDAEKMEMRASFDMKEVQWQAGINRLKADIAMRAEHVETLNKDFDKHKLKYDMLMAEKDMVSAKVDNLNAELRSRDIQTGQMEENLNQILRKQNELVSESGTAKNVEQQLRARVGELEKEVERQRNVILEAEEEKREAIRQLCFSLDHYRSGYRQLVRSISGNNRGQAVMVS